jgi:thiosulfate reductase cytochrome b subunit
MKKVFLHPLSVRIWHWINAGLVFFLLITGIQLRFPWVSVFDYNRAVFLHKVFGFILAGSFLYWLLYYLLKGGLRKHYSIRPRDLRGMVNLGLFYVFSMFRGSKNPFTSTENERFNALQKMAYLFIMLIATPIITTTGVLFADITFFLTVINFIGGIRILDAIHVAAGYVFLLYLLVHLYMATLGYRAISRTKAMITGYSEEQDE